MTLFSLKMREVVKGVGLWSYMRLKSHELWGAQASHLTFLDLDFLNNMAQLMTYLSGLVEVIRKVSSYHTW